MKNVIMHRILVVGIFLQLFLVAMSSLHQSSSPSPFSPKYETTLENYELDVDLVFIGYKDMIKDHHGGDYIWIKGGIEK